MNKKVPIIICNGSVADYSKLKKKLSLLPFDLGPVVAVDGGVTHARKLGLGVSLAIGDFDSISIEDKEYLNSEEIEMITYSSDKDKTDSELALDWCQKHFSECLITAFTGSRIDHSFANLAMFAEKCHALSITLIDSHNTCYIVKDRLTLHAKVGSIISILPLTDSIHIDETKGLYYPVIDETLQRGSTRGVSNLSTESSQTVAIQSGIALVTISED